MKIKYSLTSSDYLEYQLYNSSKSDSTRKRLRKARILFPIIYILLGFYNWNRNDNVIGITLFVCIALLWILFYPKYSKWRYKNHFEKQVEVKYKSQINKDVEVDLDKEYVITKDNTSERKVSGIELKELIETKKYFFVKLVTELCLIVPKTAVVDQVEFKKIVMEFDTEYVDDTNWKWE